MSYRVLVYAQKYIHMKDFILQTKTVLDCLSTSDLIPDAVRHIKVFEPDLFLAILGGNDDGLFSLLSGLRNENADIPIAIFGDYITLKDFQENYPDLFDLRLQRPLTSMEAATLISDYLAARGTKIREIEEKKKEPPKVQEAEKDNSKLPEPDTAPAPAEETPDAAQPQNPDSSERKRLLIIDDDRQVLKTLKMCLEANYDVTTMANGKIAEKYLETHNADLIILDYEMPVVNGADVFKHLKGIKNARDVPVVFLTGVADSSRIMEVLSLQPAGYLLKPIDIDRLRETIKQIIG